MDKHIVQDINSDRRLKEIDKNVFEQFTFPSHFQKIEMYSMVLVFFFEVIDWSPFAPYIIADIT